MIKIIVAYDKNFLIGDGDNIPWNLPEDMEHFKESTERKSVIMGRKTWDSLPSKFKPLPNRFNAVVTRKKIEPPLYYDPTEPYWGNSIDSCIKASHKNVEGEDVYIIGGGEIYRNALENNLVNEIIASEIKGSYKGDVHFPNVKEMGWDKSIVKEFDDFTIVKYVNPST